MTAAAPRAIAPRAITQYAIARPAIFRRAASALLFAAAGFLAAASGPARAAEALLMECSLSTPSQHDRATEALGSPLRIALDPEAREIRLGTTPVSGALEGVERTELVWLDEARLRAVAVVVGEKTEQRAPVHVLDLDFAQSRLRFGAYGDDFWEFEAVPEALDYDCRRLN